jgi:hypothetical protein
MSQHCHHHAAGSKLENNLDSLLTAPHAAAQDIILVDSWSSLRSAVSSYSGDALRVQVLPKGAQAGLPVLQTLEIFNLSFNLTIEPEGYEGGRNQPGMSLMCSPGLRKHAVLIRWAIKLTPVLAAIGQHLIHCNAVRPILAVTGLVVSIGRGPLFLL